MDALTVAFTVVWISAAPTRRIFAEPEIAVGGVDETWVVGNVAAVVKETARAKRPKPALYARVGNASRRRGGCESVGSNLQAGVAPHDGTPHDHSARVGGTYSTNVIIGCIRPVAIECTAVERHLAVVLGQRCAAAGPCVVAHEKAVLHRHIRTLSRMESTGERSGRIAVVFEYEMADRRVRKAVHTTAVLVAGVRRRAVREHDAVYDASGGVSRDKQAVPCMTSINDSAGEIPGE